MSGRSTVLLHHCCAPCSPGVIHALAREHELRSFWFNPNVHPAEEHELRLASLRRYTEEVRLHLSIGPAMTQEEWLAAAGERAGEERCRWCYRLRLSETARAASARGIAAFSTTLLSSPYQKHEIIRQVGEEIAGENGLRFVYRDLRAFYYEGKDEARRSGLYLQKYCGCIFSRAERFAARRAG